MSSLEDIEIGLPFEIGPSAQNKSKARLSRKEYRQKRNFYPVLIVENLPKSFGKIDKNNRKKRQEIAKEEEYLLN